MKIQHSDHAGELAKDKIAKMAAETIKAGAAAVVLTDPSSIAWTFNIRGSGVPHTPHPLARAIIHADGSAEIFLDKRKTGIGEAYLTQLARIEPPSSYHRSRGGAGSRRRIDHDRPDHAPFALAERIRASGSTVVEAADPAYAPPSARTGPKSTVR